MTTVAAAGAQVPVVGAVVVTYFPDAGVADRLAALLEQVPHVVIVDNGSDAASLGHITAFSDHDGVTLIANAVNRGIATALNQGMTCLCDNGCDWVLTVDQDSLIANGFIAAQLATLGADPAPQGVAMIGAERRDDGARQVGHRWLRPKKVPPFFERVPCHEITGDGVTLVITSGTLLSVAAYQHLGPFRDDFFIDLVDFEYCLRARGAGLRILVACGATLHHRVGEKTSQAVLGLGLSATHHAAVRRYYLFRNVIATVRAHGLRVPHWLIYQGLALCEIVAGIVLFERGKAAKLRACALGLWDGVLGRLGPARREF